MHAMKVVFQAVLLGRFLRLHWRTTSRGNSTQWWAIRPNRNGGLNEGSPERGHPLDQRRAIRQYLQLMTAIVL